MGNLTGKKIRQLRRKLGMTQPQFAALVGVTKMTIINWEQERRKPTQLAQKRLQQVRDERV